VSTLALAVPAAVAPSRASLIQQNSGRTSTADGSVGKPTAAVSLGYSYISGEAGRWQGNSVNPTGSRDGPTERLPARATTRVASTSRLRRRTDAHRSDVAEVRSASLPVQQKINISCSGAVTRNIFRSLSGLRADGQPVVSQPARGPDGVLRPPSSSAALVAAPGR
jgi:hypothetical protein